MMLMSDPKPNDAFVWVQEPWGRALRCTAMPAAHLFTSSDLILRRDSAEWNSVASSLGVTIDRLLLIRQVHGTAVAVARRGASHPWSVPEADIIITDDPDLAIGVRVADCTPVLLADPKRRIAGAVHAGWRGTAAGAAAGAVRAMRDTFGSDPTDIVAAIGPCLGSCCGEVGTDVVDAFRAGGHRDADIDRWFRSGPTPRPYLDLEQANRDQLASAGVFLDHIHASGLCTKTHRDRFHSYRASKDQAGRLLAAVKCRMMDE
jgi:YfiH family protein